MSVGWYVGNADDEARLLGHFIDPTAGAVRTTEELEVKWGSHPAGHRRPEWTCGDQRSTLLFMVSHALQIRTRICNAEILAITQRGRP